MLSKDFVSGRLAWACRGILGMVFLFAAFPKIFNLKAFADIIDAYGIVPERALIPVALVLSLLEVAGGVGVLLNRGWRLSLVVIFGLLLLFIGVLSYGLWMGFDIDCGCFGKDEPKHRFFSSLRSALYRDLLLLLPVAYLFWHGWLNQKRMKEMQNGDMERNV
jgi:hypothetical protein